MKNTFTFFLYTALLFTWTSLSAQKWDTLSPIPESFTFPVVVELGGRIHIMGGGGPGGATDLHLVYDPYTDTWDTLAPVPYKAQQPAGAAANGMIHFFGGGFPNTGTPLDDHYLYDPSSDSWSQAADLTAPRAIHYGVALNDTVYSLAGQGMANLCQAYDVQLDEWVTKNNLPDNAFWYGAHVATEGHIYRFCGGGYTAPNKLAHRYDPGNDTWAALPMFPNATHGIRGAAIGTKIFLAGGYYDFLDRDEVWVFDTETEQYTAGIPLPRGRTYHNMVAIDDCIYVLGGNNAIDPGIGVQLLRLCPFESTSIADVQNTLSWSVSYFSGILKLHVPEQFLSIAQVSLIDVQGRQLFSAYEVIGQNHINEFWIGDLTQGVYFVRIQADGEIYTERVVVNQ